MDGGGWGRGAGVMEGETAIFRKGGAPTKQQEREEEEEGKGKEKLRYAGSFNARSDSSGVCRALHPPPQKSHSHTQFDPPEQKSILHHHNCRPPLKTPPARPSVFTDVCERLFRGLQSGTNCSAKSLCALCLDDNRARISQYTTAGFVAAALTKVHHFYAGRQIL